MVSFEATEGRTVDRISVRFSSEAAAFSGEVPSQLLLFSPELLEFPMSYIILSSFSKLALSSAFELSRFYKPYLAMADSSAFRWLWFVTIYTSCARSS